MLHPPPPPPTPPQVAVPEGYQEFKGFLDVIYDRSVQIQAEGVMPLFQLADKYQAPSLMEACRWVGGWVGVPCFWKMFLGSVGRGDGVRVRGRQAGSYASIPGTAGHAITRPLARPAVPCHTAPLLLLLFLPPLCRPILMSDAFRLSIRNGSEVVAAGHADWLEVLALASKHRYSDLFTRCTDFLLEQARERPVLLATNFITGSQQLKELRQASTQRAQQAQRAAGTARTAGTAADAP